VRPVSRHESLWRGTKPPIIMVVTSVNSGGTEAAIANAPSPGNGMWLGCDFTPSERNRLAGDYPSFVASQRPLNFGFCYLRIMAGF
jgi:hypothetical protein